jgi:tRNA pseudouridine32 synthase/23S rRNA pseudouridine746 synthase
MPITEPKETEEAFRLCQEIDVIYEDSCFMVINKPSGLLSVPGKSEMPSVENYLSRQGSFPYLRAVHRLDQDTSGILVLAKDPESYKTLQAYFQRRDILKRYEAVVMPDQHSILAERPSGMIDLPLLPNPFDRPRQMVDRAHGKAALTRYEVRERLADGSYFVDFYPLTGRTHQLRVHAAHPDGLNAPIVGDRLYGSSGLSPRLMLHAAEIRFIHPQTQKEMHFCIPFSPNGTKKAST